MAVKQDFIKCAKRYFFWDLTLTFKVKRSSSKPQGQGQTILIEINVSVIKDIPGGKNVTFSRFDLDLEGQGSRLDHYNISLIALYLSIKFH